MPFLSNAAASSKRITPATVRAFRSSHPRAASSTLIARSRANTSIRRATPSGSTDAREKSTQSTTY